MDDDRSATEFQLAERGYEGILRIEDREGGRHVVLSGIRTDGTEAAVEKDVPADRDERLGELVTRALTGDDRAAVDLLAHLGVLDPEP